MSIILHDYFQGPDGGGKLALTLARGLGLELCYGFKAENHPYFAQKDSLPRHFPLIHGPAKPFPFKQLSIINAFRTRTSFLKNHQTVIFSGSYSPLAAVNCPEARKIYYCHTPPRFLFDQKQAFIENCPYFLRPFMRLYLKHFQAMYLIAVKSMDAIVANSENVRQRIRKYLKAEAQVVHPPVDIHEFKWIGQKDYFLSPARLDHLKRVRNIVQAFKAMPEKKLVVVSSGPELEKIMSMAAGRPNIKVLGRVSNRAMKNLTGNCLATVYVPDNEDFGISPLESMSAGKPVIGVAQGGLLETVIHEQTGLLIPPAADPEDIAAAVRLCTPETALSMRAACHRRAEKFNTASFLKNFTVHVRP